MLKFRPMRDEDFDDLINLELRSKDSKENFMTTGMPDYFVMYETILRTDIHGGEVLVIEVDEEIVGACGIINKDGDGIVWMLTEREFPNHVVKFYRESKKLIERWSQEYLLMFNYILVERAEDFRFLEMLGFHVDTDKEIILGDASVYRFYMQGR